MQTKNLYLFTRTPLHIGAGASVGAIDQPIQRERHTGFPIIPGSSIKGVMRDAASQIEGKEAEVDDAFGPEDSSSKNSEKVTRAGNISFTEARVLAFPVRSAKGAFAYVTCPLLLNHFKRLTNDSALPDLPEIAEQSCLAAPGVTFPEKKATVLEEYRFDVAGNVPAEWIAALSALVADPVWKTLAQRLAILNDGDFAHFVKSTTEISNHNRINAETGTVEDKALFNLECVPAETLFMASVYFTGRKQAAVKTKSGAETEIYATDSTSFLSNLISERPLLQFGGASTTGRGFCTLSLS